MNLRSRIVLLDFVCLKKCGELHFGQERGLPHSTVVLGDKIFVDLAFGLTWWFHLLLDFT
jgi:hypothetical protein